MALVEVKVPDIGDAKDVAVIEILVAVGDTVAVEQSLATVESDKASMELPSTAAGVVKELRVGIGDKVSEGSSLLMLEAGGPAAAGAAGGGGGGTAPAKTPAAAPATDSAAAASEAGSAKAPSSVPTSAAAPPGLPSNASPAAAPAETPSDAVVDAVVPDIGDFDEVAVIEVLVKPGDAVKVEQSLLTVESDKASMEIPSAHAGTMKEVRIAVGDKVSKGTVIGTIALAGGAVGAAPAASPRSAAASEGESAAPETRPRNGLPPSPSGPAPETAAPSSGAASTRPADTTSAPSSEAAAASAADDAAAPAATARLPPTAALPPHEPAAPKADLPHASPSIRRFARELGLPLEEVQGSGPRGRITQDDLQGFVKRVMAGDAATGAQAAKAATASSAGGAQGGGSPVGAAATAAAGNAAHPFAAMPPWPKVDYAKFGPVERRDLSRIQRISGPGLHRNWVTIPHVSYFDEADVTDLEAFRVRLNEENAKGGAKVTMLAFIVKAAVASLQQFPEFNASFEGDHLVLKKYFHIGFAADTPQGLVVPVLKDADRKGVLQISKEMAELAAKAREGKLVPAEMSGGSFSISSLGGIGLRWFTPLINAPEVAIAGIGRASTEPRWDGAAFQPRLILPVSLSWDHRAMDGAGAARFHAHLCRMLADFRRVLL